MIGGGCKKVEIQGNVGSTLAEEQTPRKKKGGVGLGQTCGVRLNSQLNTVASSPQARASVSLQRRRLSLESFVGTLVCGKGLRYPLE